MSPLRRTPMLVALVAISSLLAGCLGGDDTEIEPLSGLDRLPGNQVDEDPPPTEGDEVAAPAEDEPTDEAPDIDLDETPYEERDLPPDEPGPPVEPAPPPDQGVAAPPGGGAPPPPPTGPLDPDALVGVGDYCALWQTYGGIGATLDDALTAGPPERTSEVLRFMAALHQRAADLSGTDRRTDHRDMVGVLDGLHGLLGEFGHDFDAFLTAAEGDPGLLQRFGSIQAPAEGAMERIDGHVAVTCGVTLA